MLTYWPDNRVLCAEKASTLLIALRQIRGKAIIYRFLKLNPLTRWIHSRVKQRWFKICWLLLDRAMFICFEDVGDGGYFLELFLLLLLPFFRRFLLPLGGFWLTTILIKSDLAIFGDLTSLADFFSPSPTLSGFFSFSIFFSFLSWSAINHFLTQSTATTMNGLFYQFSQSIVEKFNSKFNLNQFC